MRVRHGLLFHRWVRGAQTDSNHTIALLCFANNTTLMRHINKAMSSLRGPRCGGNALFLAIPHALLLGAMLFPSIPECAADSRWKPRADTPHLPMDFEHQTRTRVGHDFKQKPLFLKIPSMTRPRFRHITLYQVVPAVNMSRMDVLFEWMGSNEGRNWTTVMQFCSTTLF